MAAALTGKQAGLTPAAAAALLLRRQRARESLMGYVEMIDVPGDPANGTEADESFLPVGAGLAIHHRVLCQELERAITTRYGRLMVFMPPGAAKSTYCSVVAPTWAMGRKPGERIILAMHNGDIAKKQGRKARSVVRQRAYQETFGTALSTETSAAEMWILENGSEYMAAGIRSGIAGNRAGGLIIDDPIRGRKDAESPQVRSDTLAAYQDDLVTRTMPGAWVVLVQTRWHEGDLAGSLLPKGYDGESGDILCNDGMMWRVLNIPAQCERVDDPLGRAVGDMLWPEWFDEKHWIAARRVNRTWSALYQQRPVTDEGNKFQREWFKWYEPHQKPPYLNRFTASDYATTEEGEADDPDFTEHGCVGVDNDGDVWFLDWFFGQVNTEVGIKALLAMAKRNRATRGFGEVGVIRRAIEPMFKRFSREAKVPLAIEYLPHIGSKEVAVLGFQALAAAGKVWLPVGAPWAERLVDQLCGFPSLTHDDAVDVCALVGRAVDQMAFARVPAGPEADTSLKPFSWKWIVHGTEGGKPKGPRVF